LQKGKATFVAIGKNVLQAQGLSKRLANSAKRYRYDRQMDLLLTPQNIFSHKWLIKNMEGTY